MASHLGQRLEAFQHGFRHNLALIGPSGSGKTYQLQQMAANAPPGMQLIYCPVYRESCRSFLQRLANSIRRAHPDLPRTSQAIEAAEGFLSRRSFSEAFNRMLDVVPVFVEETGKPCVLVLDEFLHLEDLGLGHAFQELGKRVMTWPSTLFVLASSSPYRARVILRERLQLLFGQFELLELDAPDPVPAQPWISSHLAAIPEAAELTPFIASWLGASPWYLTVVLTRVQELAALSGGGDSGQKLLAEALWDVVGRQQGPLHQWCLARTSALSHLRSGSRMMECLIHIAEGACTLTDIGSRVGRTSLSEILQQLVEQDLLQRRGSCWFIQDSVLRCWLATVAASQRSGLLVDDAVLRRRFEAFLTAVWSEWIEAEQVPFVDQIVRLFGRFSDETIVLDGKTGRLPRFSRVHAETMDDQVGYLLAEGDGKSWCAAVVEKKIDEATVGCFDAFCRMRKSKPARKVLIARRGVEPNALLLAKAVNMWVWENRELSVVMSLYGGMLHAESHSSGAPVGALAQHLPR